MNKKILSGLICLVCCLSLIIYILKPNDKPVPALQSQKKSALNTPTQSQNHLDVVYADESHDTQKIENVEKILKSSSATKSEIIAHLNDAIRIDPLELSLDIIPYISSENQTIQVLALSALNNAMLPTEDEIKDPSFKDYRNVALRENIGNEINTQFKNTKNPELIKNIIAVYDRTNPNIKDTREMVNFIYQNNKNKIPTDMEMYYLKTSFQKYPELKTKELQSYEFNDITNRLN